MFRTPTRRRLARLALSATAALALAPAGAAAQQPPRIDTPRVAVTGGLDTASDYLFRGIRQNATGVAVWPFLNVALTPYSGDGLLNRIGVTAGVWSSLHTGDTGADGPTGSAGYETDYYASIAVRLGAGVDVSTSFTAFTSPNGMFSTIKEIAVRAQANDLPALGRFAFHPSVLMAFEIDSAPGVGQADGGANGGGYLEVGVAPVFPVGRISLTAPVRVGLSLYDYYELGREDHPFGFVAVGGGVTVPLAGSLGGRHVSLRGSVEHHILGETTQAFNGGDGGKTVGSIGFRFVY